MNHFIMPMVWVFHGKDDTIFITCPSLLSIYILWRSTVLIFELKLQCAHYFRVVSRKDIYSEVYTPLQYFCLENPWTEESGGLQSMGSLRVGHDWTTSLSLFTFMYWRRKWQPILAWRIPGKGEPGGLPSMGSHRVGHGWRDLAAAAAAAAAAETSLYAVPSQYSFIQSVSLSTSVYWRYGHWD